MDDWKTMGDDSFLLGCLDVWAYFQGLTVSFREGNQKKSSKVLQFCFIFDSMDPIYLADIVIVGQYVHSWGHYRRHF